MKKNFKKYNRENDEKLKDKTKKENALKIFYFVIYFIYNGNRAIQHNCTYDVVLRIISIETLC